MSALKRAEELKWALESELRGSPGVARCSASATTGTVLLFHSPTEEPAHFVEVIRTIVDEWREDRPLV